jgi:cytosine permease
LPAVILSQYFGDGWRIPLLVIIAVAFTWTAYIGISALVVLSRFAVPAILILVLLSLGLALRDVGGLSGLTGIEPTEEVGIALAITVVFGSFASGGTQTTNWTRFCSTSRGAFFAGLSTFLLGNGLMLFAGALGALVYSQPDITEVLNEQGLLLAGLLLMLLSIWVVTDRTVYAFSVAGANLLRIENRRLLVIVGSLIGLLLAISGFYDYLVDYLLLLGTFIPPIGAVIAADFFVKRRRRLPPINSVSLPALNWAGITSYVAASAVAYFSPGIPPVNGIIAGFVFYLLLDKVFKKINA